MSRISKWTFATNFKNNSKLLGASILIIFFCIVIVNEIHSKKVRQSIEKNKATMVGKTVGCNKNIKSSMYTLHYVFTYKDIQYGGTEQLNKDKSGEICTGYFFLVEFDSLHPEYNRIVLDSLR